MKVTQHLSFWLSWGASALLAPACTPPQFDADPLEDPGPDGAARESPASDAGRSTRDAMHSPDVEEIAREPDQGDARATAMMDGSAGDAPEAGAPPVDAAPGTQPTTMRDGVCLLTGTYSVRAEMEVSWEGRTLGGLYPLVRAGTGKAIVYTRVELDGNLRLMPSIVTVCGADFPDFAAGDPVLTNEQYSFYIPQETWDGERMPRWYILWERTCEQPKPGCSIASQPLDATLGAQAFVEAPGMLMTEDHDLDGQMGLTVLARTPKETSESGTPYSRIPLSFATAARAEKVFSVVHLAATFNAQLTDCATLKGALSQPRIAIRAAGCLSQPSEGAAEVPCTAEQVRFLSDNVPPITVKSATFEAQRIPDLADCAAVRSSWANRRK